MHVYRIAEMNIAVKAKYEETYRYMADFLTDSEEYELLIEPTDEMIRYVAKSICLFKKIFFPKSTPRSNVTQCWRSTGASCTTP